MTRIKPMELLYKDLTGKILNAAMDVHNALGSGFLEAVYQEALEIELTTRGIPFVAQQELSVTYKGQTLKHKYKPDLQVDNKVIVEIKSISALTGVDEAQAIHYLKATGCKVALLINFGQESLKWKRMVLNA